MHQAATLFRTLSAVCLLLCLSVKPALSAPWADALQLEVARIDAASPGQLGVYVKRLAGGETFSYGGDKTLWYLGSTVKVPIAIAVLQQVDAGKIRLGDEVTLLDTDKIEAGQLVWRKSGSIITINELLNKMLGISDNTAANMLMRVVGEEQVNASARAAMGREGFQKITTLAQVRYDVYAELHPDARKLTNAQLVQIAAAPQGPQRVEGVRNALGVSGSELNAKTIDEAYARYYKTGVNAATLQAYATMLEKLVTGKLLSAQSTQRLFTDMKLNIFTNYRVQAGLPRSVRFIHKTGTQYQRACHSGVINPENGGAQAIIVAVCAADIDEQNAAGKVFEQVGRAITQKVLTPKDMAQAK